MSTKLHVQRVPGIEVSSDCDCSAGALVAADRPVLLEGCGADDGWLVGACTLDVVSAHFYFYQYFVWEEKAGRKEMPDGDMAYLVDIIGISIGEDRAFLGGSTAGVVGSEVLNDVVLD